jgi:uncharacterized radical SAM superfamily Fe-S cluster-containing enzyme
VLSYGGAEAVIETLRGVLREISGKALDARDAFTLAERRVKSIFIHAFQDADTFDLARVRRRCNAYPQPDGEVEAVLDGAHVRRGHVEDVGLHDVELYGIPAHKMSSVRAFLPSARYPHGR